MKKFFGWLFRFFQSFGVRAGLDKFLDQYAALAAEIVEDLAVSAFGGMPFDIWKVTARKKIIELLVSQGQTIKDNWVEILMALAYERYKVKVESSTKGA